jgi:hypothetical protein
MVSAACPLCKIIVVEGKAPTFADLAAAENTAARLGAQVISNSYGARESGFTQAVAKAYDHPGHTLVASSGDQGYSAASFPANLTRVTSAGGTELAKAPNPRGWSEVVWNAPDGASSSGCSAYVAKPAWQKDPHCPGRMAADVSALADNVPIYDSSIPKSAGGPWLTVAGTSAASPIIAGVYALAGNAATVAPGYEYAHAASLFDITIRSSTSPRETTTGSPGRTAKPAAMTTSASRRRATTGRPGSAPRTEPGPSERSAQGGAPLRPTLGPPGVIGVRPSNRTADGAATGRGVTRTRRPRAPNCATRPRSSPPFSGSATQAGSKSPFRWSGSSCLSPGSRRPPAWPASARRPATTGPPTHTASPTAT